MPRFTTRDIGLAIRDFLEGSDIHAFTGPDDTQSEDVEEVDFVDVSDASNPVLFLTNGQEFQVRIFVKK
jgi:hypothetical protein